MLVIKLLFSNLIKNPFARVRDTVARAAEFAAIFFPFKLNHEKRVFILSNICCVFYRFLLVSDGFGYIHGDTGKNGWKKKTNAKKTEVKNCLFFPVRKLKWPFFVRQRISVEHLVVKLLFFN